MEREQQQNGSSSVFQFPPGFRFHPSDEELIVYYLQNKVTSQPLPAHIIAEIDLYKYNPWELPNKALFGESEWYFFTPRDRKYPNGERPNRSAGLGFWKATGIDKPIFGSSGSKQIGVKKGLVFYTGKPPKGGKTDWMMNEYRLLDNLNKSSRPKSPMRLDDWVLCRVRHKGNISISKNKSEIQDGHSPDFSRCQPNVVETNLTCANPEMFTDFIHKDYLLLAWILAGQPGQSPPPMEANSNVNFEGTIKGNTSSSFHGDCSTNLYHPISDTYCNFPERETFEGYANNQLLPCNYLDGNKREGITLPSKRLAETDIYGNIQNQSEYRIFNDNQTNSMSKFQKLNEFMSTGGYMMQ